jgi:integrase
MTMPTKLTDDLAKNETAPEKGNRVLYDSEVKGLGLRITTAGAKAWTFDYEADGKSRRYTIGPIDAFTVGKARKQALDLKAKVRLGQDPQGDRNQKREKDKEAKRAEKEAVKPDTFADIVELFLTKGLQKKGRSTGYIVDTRRNFQNHVLPRLGNKALAEITRKDVIKMLDEIAEDGTVRVVDGKKKRAAGGPIAANRNLAAVRALFNFAIRRGLIEVNPCRLVDAPGEEKARERTLSAHETKELWAAFDTLPAPFGPYFRMLLLTGQRRGEVAEMRWQDIDLDAKTWLLTAAQTKNGRAHIVPLSPMAVDILKTMPRQTVIDENRKEQPSPWVFTTTGAVAVSGFSRAKAIVERKVLAARRELDPGAEPMAEWGIHDLRRTVATELGRLGVSEFVIGKVLNHASKSITGMVYNQYEYVSEKRHALDTWAGYLERLIKPAGDNVVVLGAGGKR